MPWPLRRGFTLLELLAVILIVVLVSAVALPTIIPAIQHRQASEAGRIVQAALAGARDQAIHDGQPSGIRLLPDPTFLARITANGASHGQIDPSQPLAYNRWIPIGPAPDYSTGLVSVYPTTAYTSVPGLAARESVLILEQSVFAPDGTLNEPTGWEWNIRVGDRVTVGTSDQVYTVVGPTMAGPAEGNAEQFVNYDIARVPTRRTPSGLMPLTYTLPGGKPQVIEHLFLVNGRDDDSNGIIDDGHNGLLPASGRPYYEPEAWSDHLAGGTANVAYNVTRRPAPQSRGREMVLPSGVVIDATTAFTTRERSRIPGGMIDPYTGAIDILLNPDGTVVPTTRYSTPAATGLDGSFIHLWLAERDDVHIPSGATAPHLPAPKGEYRLITIFTRTGQVHESESPPLDDPAHKPYDTGLPYRAAQQGAR